jgi:1,4-dihydroxy-2-naphthoate octaprenyltransferase
MSDTTAASARQGLLSRWREVLRTTNPPASGQIDPVSKWLVITRAAVLPMTITAGAVAGLLAVHDDRFHTGWFALALLGITLAHVANNLMNDLFDTQTGLDTEQYPRALYSPHPVLTGMISRRGLALACLVVNLVDLGIGLVLFTARGWPVLAFALAGFVLSAAYTAPPLRLKKRGLGEPDVFVVWGPLMVAGTYYAAVGSVPWEVYLAAVPYGLLCTAVLMGKHIDKIPWDEPAGIATLPVRLGEPRSRVATQWLMAGFYVAVSGAIALGALPWPTVVVAAALPRLGRAWTAFAEGRPAEPPADFPIWPLWFAAIAFLHTRRAGLLLVIGLAMAALTGIEPNALG